MNLARAHQPRAYIESPRLRTGFSSVYMDRPWRKPAIPRRADMRSNLVLPEEEITAKSSPFERPFTAENYVERYLRSGYGVCGIFGLSYGDVTVTDTRRRDGTGLIWMVLACLGGSRTGIWTLCAPACHGKCSS